MHYELQSESNSTVWVLYTNKEERDLGKTNAPSTDDRSVRLWVSDTGFRNLRYWGVIFFMDLYVKTSKKVYHQYVCQVVSGFASFLACSSSILISNS